MFRNTHDQIVDCVYEKKESCMVVLSCLLILTRSDKFRCSVCAAVNRVQLRMESAVFWCKLQCKGSCLVENGVIISGWR